MKWNINRSSLKRVSGTDIKSNRWLLTLYTPSKPDDARIGRHNVSRVPAALSEIETYFKKGTCIKHLIFELGVRNEVIVSTYKLVGTQRKDPLDDHLQNNDTFFTSPDNDTQCFIGTEKHSDVGKFLDSPQQ